MVSPDSSADLPVSILSAHQGATGEGGVRRQVQEIEDSRGDCGGISFAAGKYANANHLSSFVWGGDSSFDTVNSDRNYQFKIRAAGGVMIDADSAGLLPSALLVDAQGCNAVGAHIKQDSSDAVLVLSNEGIDVFLEDRIENTIVELKGNAQYDFAAATSDDEYRFNLVFKSSGNDSMDEL